MTRIRYTAAVLAIMSSTAAAAAPQGIPQSAAAAPRPATIGYHPSPSAQSAAIGASTVTGAVAAAPAKAAVVPVREVKRSRYPGPGTIERLWAVEIPYTRAVGLVEAGKVDSVIAHLSMGGSLIYVRHTDGTLYRTAPMPGRVNEDFSNKGFEITIEDGDLLSDIMRGVAIVANLLMLAVLGFLAISMARKFTGNPARAMRKRALKDATTFADVAGHEEVLAEIQEVVDFLKNPKEGGDLGGRAPRGILLVGPPGNGKTLIARALAHEAGVPFFHISGSEIIDTFVGVGSRRIRQMEKFLRKQGPCILFIDEIDRLGSKRRNGPGTDVSNERDDILTAVLTMLDGIEKRGDMVVIGATNLPDVLDDALTRPGRLDRRVEVPKPQRRARAAILGVHSRKVKLADDVDLEDLAGMTPGFSGAELANFVNEAALAARRLRKSQVDMECFDLARDRALLGAARREDIMSPEEQDVVAVHESGHALVALRSGCLDPVQKATVLPRGGSLGMVVSLPERDYNLQSKRRLMAMVAMAMGGRAAEECVFGDDVITSGASADIKQATLICRQMGGSLGMFPELGQMDYFGDHSGLGGASALSMARLEDSVRKRIDDAYRAAMTIVTQEKHCLLALRDALKERKTLTGDEVREVVDNAAAAHDQAMQEAVAEASVPASADLRLAAD